MARANGSVRRKDGAAARWRGRRWLAAGGALALLWLSAAVYGAGAGSNIFDDDWTPPKRSEAPAKPAQPTPQVPGKATAASETKPPSSPPTSNDTGSKVTEGGKSDTVAPTAPAARRKLAVPGKGEQAQRRKMLREVFAKELSDHSPEARRLLAARFLDEAEKATDLPVDEYVLLGGAYQAAKEGNDLGLCMRVADSLAGTFEVDALPLKLGALSGVSYGSDPAKARGAAVAGLALLDDAVGADDYDAVRQIAERVEQAAARAGDASLSGYVREKTREARQIAAEYARVRKDLIAAHRDASADAAIGRFLCFAKGDWPNGLPFLARGDDAALRALAEEELAGGEGKALRLADDWWAAGQKASAAIRPPIERHAATLYATARQTLTGLEKLRVERRLAEVTPYSFSVGDVYEWSRGKEAVEMIPLSQGICVLTRIGGGFYGGGEEVGMGVVASEWRLAGRAVTDPVASATALLTPGANVFRAPVEYTWKKGDSPVRMIRCDEGVCVLSGVAGGLRGEGEDVRVYPGDDGYWYLGGKSGQTVTVHALALRPAKPNTFRAIYSEAVWDVTTGPVKMIHKDEGFCFISGVSGRYEGNGEVAKLSVGADGFWYLEGKAAQRTMTARAIGVRIVPRGR